MIKSVIITIMIDGVNVGELEDLMENLEAALEDYKEKRINVSIQDNKLLSAPYLS